jgi:hypothetical protein
MTSPDPVFAAQIQSIWRRGPSPERDNLVHGIARYVSKLGLLSISDTQLRAMQMFFNVDDAVALYREIRDRSLRFEGEWREQFINYFPQARDALPPQQMTEEEYNAWLRANGKDF